MAIGPTVTVTINSVAKNLSLISTSGYSSEYFLREATGEYRMVVRHSTYKDAKRGNQFFDRHNVEFVQTLYPVAPATNTRYRKYYIVIENLKDDVGTDVNKFMGGFAAFQNEALAIDLMNWDS